MTEKLKRHIQDTANTLQLNPEQTEYLKNCMDIAYKFGQRDQIQEDYEMHKRLMK